MRGSILTSLLNWLACHLVAWGLLGFLLWALILAGVVRLPGARGTDAAVGTDIHAPAAGLPRDASDTVPRAAPLAGPTQEAGSFRPAPDAVVGDKGPADRQAARPRTPKLIGGSIPLYEQPRFAPPVRAAAPAAEEGFRPSDAGQVAQPQDRAPTRDDLVQQARRAFWNGDFEAAEAAYMALISAYPGDADGFGELGNLYESMGRPAAALDAFFEAGVRLKAGGGGEKLSQIIELLTREGDPRVDQLTP